MKISPRDKAPSIAVIGLLALSFFVLAVTFKPAYAATPNVNNACNGDSGAPGSSITVSCTITTGDVVAVFGETEGASPDNTLYSISSVTSTGVSGGFTQVSNVQAQCIGAVGYCSGVGNGQTAFASVWVGTATSTGLVNFIVTASGTASADIGAQVYDMVNVNTTPTFIGVGSCNATKTGDCGSPFITSTPASPQTASVYVVGAIDVGGTLASAGSQFTYNGGAHTSAGEFSQNTLVPPTSFPIVPNGNTGFQVGYAMLGLVFGTQTATTVTTVINTNCLGAGCSGGANATSTYFSTAIPPLFVFYASQNTASAGQIDNFTMKVKAVHINAQTGNLLIGIYQATTPTTQPSGGNQYSLVKSVTFPVSNGTTDFFIHANPQANICASCYYAAGIMSATTASRGSGATGSGVSFYESSQAGVVQYQFNPGSAALPTTFFSSTVLRPNFFMFIHETYSVATVTTTSTLTLSGLVTSTSTVTTTSTNVINQLDMSKAGFWFLPLLFFLAPMALLIVVKRVADGR